MTPQQAPRVGIVGPARTRIGLGPFLARELEVAGARVVAVCGRDVERTAAVAAGLADAWDHAVEPYVSISEMLRREGLDALVIAAPIEVHRPALLAAIEARVSVLCEKPLVTPEEHDRVPELVDAFVERGLLLVENCIWPCALPAFEQLHPGVLGQPIEEVEMHLSPVGRGPSMLIDSLSHLLSMIQHVVPVDASTRLAAVSIEGGEPGAERLDLRLELETPFPRLRSTLYLERCESQPRPAWISINGKRADRRIRTSDYGISFWSGDRSVEAEDPLAAFVRSFVQLLRGLDRDRVRTESTAVRERARLFRGILDAWEG